MDISVVIPLYNQGQYLSDCLNSVLNQTVKPKEIIVVNDGSTDDSLEIARKFPVKVINQVNKGLPSARNTGIMNATGEYIAFLDADDKFSPKYIQRIVEYAGDTNADVIAPSFQCFGISNIPIVLMTNPTFEDFKEANRIGYCTAIKREVLLEVGGYSPRMWAGYEDLHLWFNLMALGKKIVTIPEILWFYRTKEKSMIHESIKHHKELMSQIAKDFPQFGPWKDVETPLPR